MAVSSLSAILVFRGRGDCTFDPAVSFPVGFACSSLAAGDIDGDGRPDLATCITSRSWVSILRNTTPLPAHAQPGWELLE